MVAINKKTWYITCKACFLFALKHDFEFNTWCPYVTIPFALATYKHEFQTGLFLHIFPSNTFHTDHSQQPNHTVCTDLTREKMVRSPSQP